MNDERNILRESIRKLFQRVRHDTGITLDVYALESAMQRLEMNSWDKCEDMTLNFILAKDTSDE